MSSHEQRLRGLGLDETDSADNDVSIEDTLPAPKRAARNDKPEPAKTNTKPDTVKNQEENSTTGFISAMSEFRKLFQRFPGLLEAGKALKNAKSDEEMLDIYMGVMASTVTPQPSP
ncbi:hypothetical protein TNCT_368291 [Trichonephila clavata]|uniref:Uncharacterized protein n=1 Tax=Trichonephila clavata TaxID=2740835 RepID=A0A8X6FHM0_TRICU|nr:hypothetical protein TNCT_368291 [Trichonephila clavata]